MKSEFRKSTSLEFDIRRWQTTISEGKEQLDFRLKEIKQYLEDDNGLLKQVKINGSDLADKLQADISGLRDIIYNLEGVIEETEGIEDLSPEELSSKALINSLREYFASTRILDDSTLIYIKAISINLKNGHKSKELENFRKEMLDNLEKVEQHNVLVHTSLDQLLNELLDIQSEMKNLSRNKIV